MTVLFMLIRLIEFVVVVGVIGLIANAVLHGKIGDAIARYFKKKSEYYDVEKLDDAEIIARKYQKKGK